jgi:hypothetical protein
MVGFAEFARALLHNGDGNAHGALAAARRALDELVFFKGVCAARAVRGGRSRRRAVQVADDAFAALCHRTAAAGTDWARGIETCCAALPTTGDEADTLYRASLEYLERAGAQGHLARTKLLYGERLRRDGQRARAHTAPRGARRAFRDRGRSFRRTRRTRAADARLSRGFPVHLVGPSSPCAALGNPSQPMATVLACFSPIRARGHR